MDTEDMGKAEAVQKCLLSLQRFGIDVAGLRGFTLSGVEQRLVASVVSSVDKAAHHLNQIGRKKITQPELETKQDTQQNRTRGSLKL